MTRGSVAARVEDPGSLSSHKDKSTRATSVLTSASKPAPSRGTSKERKINNLPAPRPDAFYPNHVRACANSGLPGPIWSLHFWPVENPAGRVRTPYTCGSFRCPSPKCRAYAAASDWTRITQAFDGLDPEGIVFLVLTLDRNGTYSGRKPWRDEQEAFRDLSRLWQATVRRLRDAQEARGWQDTGNRWVMTIESHRSGWPHANVLLYSPELAAELREEAECLRGAGASSREAMLARGWMLDIITAPTTMGREGESGAKVVASWGQESTAEAARNGKALASYVVKLAGEGSQLRRDGRSQSAGELAKLCQAPSNARMKLRRLRSGQGFLPARLKNKGWTGAMLKQVPDPVLGVRVEPVQGVTNLLADCTPEYIEGVRGAVEFEEALIREGKPIGVGPVYAEPPEKLIERAKKPRALRLLAHSPHTESSSWQPNDARASTPQRNARTFTRSSRQSTTRSAVSLSLCQPTTTRSYASTGTSSMASPAPSARWLTTSTS